MVDFLIGLTLGVHYVIFFRQFRPFQDDLKHTGYIVATGMTLTLILIFLVMIAAVVVGQSGGVRGFFADAVARAPDYYRAVLDRFRRLWSELLPLLSGRG